MFRHRLKRKWMQEIHIWFPSMEDFRMDESRLKKMLAKDPGSGSVFIFFRDSKQYMALGGYSFNCKKLVKIEKMLEAFGLKNIDVISRVSSRRAKT